MIYRNKKLLALARIAPKCFCCGKDNDETIVAAHLDSQSMGKGMGFKAADVVAFVCHQCHDAIDGRNNIYSCRLDRQSEWAMACVKSIRWALENHPEVFK